MKLIKRFVSFLLAALASSLGASAYTLNRVSVHDPSIVWEPTTQTYYIFGSHRQSAKTTDLMNWTAFTAPWGTASSADATNADAFTTNQNTIFGGGKNYNAYAWASAIATNSNNGNNWGSIDGNMWAPDVIWNPTMNKWCMYLSLNGVQWNSCIILLTADNIEGPYTYQAPVVYSGFNVTNADATSYKNTDLELALGEQSTLPERYAVGNSWGTFWPHCIDPCVFYDEDGNLWMSYGSWSGGIYILRLNKENGLRDYTYKPDLTYSDNANNETVLSDPYFGKKIAGGCYSSGEASYIEYIDGYYYLFISYGFYTAAGGYQMRVFRSTSPEGPYQDSYHGANTAAIFSSYRMNYGANQTSRGENIFGCYGNWGNLAKGIYSERAQGHNSIIAAQDGRTYLVYHTRFQNRDDVHEVRVHQVFQNENGWLVAAPFEYTGETVTNAEIASTQKIATADIPGHYKLLVHRNGLDHTKKEIVTPVEIELKSDGTITGEYSGSWNITKGKSYITITLGGTTYKGVLVEQTMEPTNDKVIAFTAMANSDGVCIWGHKFTPDEPITSGYDITTGIKAYYNFDDTPITNYFDNTQNATLQKEGDNSTPVLQSDSERSGKVIHTMFGASGNTSNVKFSNPLYGQSSLNEATIAFWVNSIDENNWDALFSFYKSDGGRLYMTGNNYIGYNSGGWIDMNHPNSIITGDLTFGNWNFVTVTFSRTDGVKVYVDGVHKPFQVTANGDSNLDYNSMMVDFINNCPDFYFGYGSWWGSTNALYDELLFYNRALSATDTKALYQKEVADNKFLENSPNPLLYVQDFESASTEIGSAGANFGIAGATLTGTAGAIGTGDPIFGKYYINNSGATASTTRANYLTLATEAFASAKSAGNNELTISFWLNPYHANTANITSWAGSIFVAYTSTGNNAHGPTFGMDTRACFAVHSNCNNAEYYYDESPGACGYTTDWLTNDADFNNSWHHVALAYSIEGTTVIIKQYIDGELKQTYTKASNGTKVESDYWEQLTEFVIGGNSPVWEDPDNLYAYDEIKIYSIALTSEQIAEIIADKNYTPKFTYSVTASYGGKTKELASGTGDKNANVTVAYPRYILDGSTLYEADKTSTNDYYHTSFILSSNTKDQTIDYKKSTSHVYYYAEGEDVMTGSANSGGAGTRTSMGAVGRNPSGSSSTYTDVIKLPAGKWQIGAHFYCGNTTGAHTANIKVGDEVKWTKTFENNSSGSYENVTDPFELESEAMVSMAVDGGSATGIDWIYIKSAEPTETVGASDLSTATNGAFSSNYTMKKGDTKVFSFWNHGQSYGKNWRIIVKESETWKSTTCADFFDYTIDKHLDADGNDNAEDWALMSTDNGSTKVNVNWDNFTEDMADALVVATITYDADGKLSINAVSTGMKNGYKYYVDNVGHITCTGDLTVNLSVDHSWLELISVQDLTIELSDDGTGNSNATLLAENSNKKRNVRLDGRTLFKDGYWNTLCLPFNLGDAAANADHHFDGTLLEGATVMTLASTDFSGGTLTMTFADANSIEAGKPYIVKWTTTGDNIVNPVFTDVTISNDNPINITTSYADFCGTYAKLAFAEDTPSILFLGAQSTLYYPLVGASIGACRGYFQLKGLTAGNIAQARMFFGDDTTGIVQLTKEPKSEGADNWYTLDGRRLARKPARSGIYVKDGRKQVIP